MRTVLDALGRHRPSQVGVLGRTNDQLTSLQRAPGRRRCADGAGHRAFAARRHPRRGVQVRRPRTIGRMGGRCTGVERRGAPRVGGEVDRYLASNEPGGLRMWVESRRPFDDLTMPENKGVAVVTFHAAKGREWDAVVVTGVEEGLVPHASATNAAQRAEEARLLYVAIDAGADRADRDRRRRAGRSTRRAEPVARCRAVGGRGRSAGSTATPHSPGDSRSARHAAAPGAATSPASPAWPTSPCARTASCGPCSTTRRPTPTRSPPAWA